MVGAHWSLLVEDAEAKVLEAHESGIELVAWTVDDPHLAEVLAAAGVSAIVSNDPVALVDHLSEAAGRG